MIPRIALVMLVLTAGFARADVVTDWNQTAIGVITAANAGGGTAGAARVLATVHAAVFDAVNGIEPRYMKYAVDVSPAAGASAEAAAAAAAHAVLLHYAPSQKKELDAALELSLSGIATPARHAGSTVGRAAAAGIISLRSHDGMDAKVIYTPREIPGAWRPTPPSFAPPSGSQLGGVKPFLLKAGDQFSIPGPPALDSEIFARDMLEIRSTGARNSTTRTADQTAVAIFWTIATYAPFNAAARAVVAQRSYSLVDSARLFALLNMAGMDSQIACWHWKYHYGFWRPITAIRNAGTAGNPALKSDAGWEPLLNTPPHPDYPSGHACYGGVAAEVLRAVVGEDRIEVSVSGPTGGGVTRTYTSFSQMDREVIDARVWGGIHFRNSDEHSSRLGREIGRHAVKTWLLPLVP